ncbi:MAG: DUF1993 domain-containing protein [Stagnimonas sp.]|nr:DUF1993 domain-containing protein [Stagnimonas sp.]
MSLSMYQASVPVLVRVLSNFITVLEKAKTHAEAKKLDPLVLTSFRLYPDMLPLTKQVQIATDMAKGGGARLAGVEVPKYEDNETSFDELVARLDKTIEFLRGLDPKAIEGTEAKDIVLAMRSGPVKFKGQEYLLNFVLPNVYFHAATGYNILRHNGVEIGKMDFLGKLE